MSEVAGLFKSKVLSVSTNQEGKTPSVAIAFELLEEKVGEVFESLAGVPESRAWFTYFLKKEKGETAKMSSYEYSKLRFKKDWGFELEGTIEEISDKIVGQERVLVIEADMTSDFNEKHHKIKWINHVAGQKREGQVDLSSIL